MYIQRFHFRGRVPPYRLLPESISHRGAQCKLVFIVVVVSNKTISLASRYFSVILFPV